MTTRTPPDRRTASLQRSSTEEGKIISYYTSRIRWHSAEECRGVVRSIWRLEDDGFTLHEIWAAVKNYEAQKPSDEKYLKSIRYFFQPQNVRLWQTPGAKLKRREPSPEVRRLQQIDERLAKIVKPVTHTPLPIDPVEDDDDDFTL